MKTRHLLCLAVLIGVAPSVVSAAEPTSSQDEAAIRKNVAATVDAFNRRDAKAFAAFWSPEAIYSNRTTGQELVGHDAIEKAYEELFKEEKDRKLAVSTSSIDFVAPSVAIEHGTAKVSGGSDPVEDTTYTAVYVKRDGKWLLDRLTDEVIPEVQTHYEQLKELEWMIGSWVDEDKEDNAQIMTECKWTKNQNFMSRAFTVSITDRINLSGIQIIGWDPAAKQIRSWVFDSDGGFAEGTWKHKGNCWYIKQSGVLPDGGHSSEVNILTKLDDNSYTWQSIDREVDGELQPNVDEIKVVRDNTP